MTEAIGATSGLVALVAFAFESSVILCDAVKIDRSCNRPDMQDLSGRLDALRTALNEFSKMIGPNLDGKYAALRVPLLRCGKACQKFRDEVLQSFPRFDANRISYPGQKNVGTTADGFVQLISRYKSLVDIAMCDARLPIFTADDIRKSRDMVRTAQANFKDHLVMIDNQVEILNPRAGEDATYADISDMMKEERLSMKECIHFCVQVSSRIDEMLHHVHQQESQSDPLYKSSQRNIYDSLRDFPGSAAQTAPRPHILGRQCGALVTLDGNTVTKEGHRVTRNEEAAMRLVRRHTEVPVPTVLDFSYRNDHGKICMSLIDGEVLEAWWDDYDDNVKERICRHTWQIILDLRTIPRPSELEKYFQVNADGTASQDVLIAPLPHMASDPLYTDQDIRQRIFERYLYFHGERYQKELPDMLPLSEKSVFTHGDIAPRNILIGDNREYPVIGIVDWECAGWYPEYWEYANILKPSGAEDWQLWMQRTAPKHWDISGITAARRVLF